MVIAVGMAGALSQALAQGTGNDGSGSHNSWTNGVPPGTNNLNSVSNYYNWNYSWSNYFHYSNDFAWGTNGWWHDGNQQSNQPAPKQWQQKGPQVVGAQGRPDDRPRRAGQGEQPADVQQMVQKFQENRQALMKQLKGASDEQRQQVLQQMEQLRTRMREQIAGLRDQAQQQAEQMRTRFRSNMEQLLDAGAAGNNADNGGKPR